MSGWYATHDRQATADHLLIQSVRDAVRLLRLGGDYSLGLAASVMCTAAEKADRILGAAS